MSILSLEQALKLGGRTDLIEHCWYQDGKFMFYARFNRVFADLSHIGIEFSPLENFTFSPSPEQDDIPSELRLDGKTIISTVNFIASSILSRTKTFDGYKLIKTENTYEGQLERLEELQSLFLRWEPQHYVPAHNNPYIRITNSEAK